MHTSKQAGSCFFSFFFFFSMAMASLCRFPSTLQLLMLALALALGVAQSGEPHRFCAALEANVSKNVSQCSSFLQAASSPTKLKAAPSLRLAMKHRDHWLITNFPDQVPGSHSDRLRAAMHRDAGRMARRGLEQIRRFNFDPEASPEFVSLSGAMASGSSLGSGEYVVEIGIGTPANNTVLIVDTGSDLTWLQCQPCRHCFPQLGPIFLPASSSSFLAIACGSPECDYVDPPDGTTTGTESETERDCGIDPSAPCRYFQSYGDHSNTTGTFAYEAFTLQDAGGNGNTDQISPVLFGCGDWNQGLFRGAAGLLGLGQGAISWASQVGPLYGNRFSYCMVDRASALRVTSSLMFGHDPRLRDRDMQWTALLTLPSVGTYYYVQVQGVRVGDRLLPVPRDVWQVSPNGNGGTIVDSGTTLTYMASPAVDMIREAFRRQMPFPRRSSDDDVLDFCFDISRHKRSWRSRVPKLAILFQDGAVMRLPVDNYLVLPDDDADDPQTVCLAVMALPPNSTSILGNMLQQNFHIVYDRDNIRLGFSPADCKHTS